MLSITKCIHVFSTFGGQNRNYSFPEYIIYLLNGIGTSGDSRSSDPEVDVVNECAC